MTTHNGRRHLSAAELITLLSHVRGRADLARQKGTTRAVVDELIVLLLAGAGLRPHELRALKIADLPGMQSGRGLWIRDANGGFSRKVDIQEDLAERLAKFVRFYRDGVQADDLLLESERGSSLSYMSLYSKIRRIGQEAGISHLSPALLRRAYVQQLYQAEQDLRYTQEQAGYRTRRSVAQAVKTYRTVVPCDASQSPKAGSELTGMDPGQEPTCEACGTMITEGRGRRIESGQLLCETCLKYFRRT